MDRNNLSPLQFGFLMVPNKEHMAALSARKGKPTRRSIPADSQLRTSQNSIYKGTVDKYADTPPKAPGGVPMFGDERPEVLHHEGRLYIGEGHHRLAAAIQRGDKTLDVNWWEH